MIPHFALLYVVYSLALIAQSRHFSRGISLLFWISIVAAMTTFAGLRADSVGADTIAYVGRFEYLATIDAIWDSAGSTEVGYKALLAIARLISDDPTTLLMLTSFVASLLYISALYRLSVAPALSIFVFIAFGFFAFHMNGLRQGLALGVYLHAIPALQAGKPRRYAIWVLLASLFHVTAIFTLPLYFLFRRGFSIGTVTLLTAFSALLAVSMGAALNFAGIANERYALYVERTETGGTMLALFHVLSATVFLAGWKVVRPEWRQTYGQLVLMFLFGTAIYVVVLLSGSYVETNRMALYFTVSMAFLWPMLLRSVRETYLHTTLLSGLILAGTIFYYMYLQQIGNFVPYVIR